MAEATPADLPGNDHPQQFRLVIQNTEDIEDNSRIVRGFARFFRGNDDEFVPTEAGDAEAAEQTNQDVPTGAGETGATVEANQDAIIPLAATPAVNTRRAAAAAATTAIANTTGAENPPNGSSNLKRAASEEIERIRKRAKERMAKSVRLRNLAVKDMEKADRLEAKREKDE